MTLEEFKERAEKDGEWAPGWDEIDSAFAEVYGEQEPKHFATVLTSRAMFGGDEYLDGYSAYKSAKGYAHVVTYGMSELYASEESFGGEFSKWGYEMTIKLKGEEPESCIWAMDMLGNFARYTFTSERWFEPGQYVGSAKQPSSIDLGRPESAITSLLVTNDTEIKARNTIYGELLFLQLVGITTQEFLAVKEDPGKIPALLELIRSDYPDLETDMYRTKNYI